MTSHGLRKGLSAMISIVALDQLSKIWATRHLSLFVQHPIAGQSFLTFTRYLNRGLAWGYYSSVPSGFIEWYTRYLPSAILGLTLFVLFLRWKESSPFERFGGILLLAGGFSNLISHWFAPCVTDTLGLYLGRGQYLPFNIADVAVTSGAALLVLCLTHELFSAQDAARQSS